MQLKSGRATSQKQVCVASGPVPFPFHLSTVTNTASGPQCMSQSEDMSFVAQDPGSTAGTLRQLAAETIRRKSFLVHTPDP